MDRAVDPPDWTGVAPNDSPIEPLDSHAFVVRLRRLSERAASLTVLRAAFAEQHPRGEQLLVSESARLDDLRTRAVTVTLDHRTFLVASIDDLIAMKRTAGRLQDILDITQAAGHTTATETE